MRKVPVTWIVTTDEYWDCDCIINYIHPKSEKYCPLCGATAESSPDSRVNEVLAEGFELDARYK